MRLTKEIMNNLLLLIFVCCLMLVFHPSSRHAVCSLAAASRQFWATCLGVAVLLALTFLGIG